MKIIKYNFIWPIERTLTGTIISGPSEPGNDSNQVVLHIPQNPSL